jgi:hypothetical protein
MSINDFRKVVMSNAINDCKDKNEAVLQAHSIANRLNTSVFQLGNTYLRTVDKEPEPLETIELLVNGKVIKISGQNLKITYE